MKTSNILTASLFACVLGFAASAQAQDAPKEHSMTGCLAKGDDAGTFKLTDLASGPKVVVIAFDNSEPDAAFGPQGRDHGRCRPGEG